MKSGFFVFSSTFLLFLASCHSNTTQPSQNRAEAQKSDISPSLASGTSTQSSLEKSNDLSHLKFGENKMSSKRVVEFDPSFINFEEFKENLNKFIVHIDLATHENTLKFNCKSISGFIETSNLEKKIDPNLTSAEIEIDISKSNNQINNFRCLVQDGNNIILENNFDFKRDVLVSESKDIYKLNTIPGENTIGNLVLADGVVFETLGENLDLKIDKLISKDAMIASFENETNLKAPNNQDGLSGGNIKIWASEAYGHLVLKMRGQDAGNVSILPPKMSEVPQVDSSYNGIPFTYQDIAHGGEGQFHEIKVNTCPTDGKKGRKGFTGFKGYPGRTGGNSGIANIYIGTSENTFLEMYSIKGSGGNGGLPGEPGVGSEGGNAGQVDVPKYFGLSSCGRYPVNGAHGDVGDVGEIGNRGLDGQIEKSSFQKLK